MAMNLNQVTDTITPSTGGLNVVGLISNATSIVTSFSILANYNAMSVGPVTVASGVSVTVPSGSRWVVI